MIESPTKPSPWLHRFALFLAAYTLFLVFAGALVTSRDAGLSVPDWPLAFGMLFPPGWWGAVNIRAEHGHRLVATMAGIFTIVLTVWLHRQESRRWVRRLGYITLVAVITQGLLGGATVHFLLPVWLSVSHALLGQSFLCLTWVIALVTSAAWREKSGRLKDDSGFPLPRLSLLLTVVIFMQLFFGAVMRHTDSGLALVEIPTSFEGKLLPPTDAEALERLALVRYKMNLSPARMTSFQVWIHFTHRAWALVVCLAAAVLAKRIFGPFIHQKKLVIPIFLILGLLALQIILGVLVIFSLRQPHLTTFHVAVGALTLAISVVLTIESFRLVETKSSPGSVVVTSEPMGQREAAS